MSRPLIGKLWLAIRENFLRCNIEKLKGDKFTNTRVSIESEDADNRVSPRDVGGAMIFVGGTHMGGLLHTNGPTERTVDVWGKPSQIDRKYPHGWGKCRGSRWMIEYISWSKVRATQPYAAWMMDSVAAGGLMPSVGRDQEDQGVINNVEGTMDICHQDKKYPPWKEQEVDE